LLNCLYLAAELWDWLEKHLSVFKALARILVDFNIHASGCMTMHQCNIQRLRFCFFVMSVATFSRLAPETQQPRFSGAANGCYGKWCLINVDVCDQQDFDN
jgi:hypothetical protein